jgi:ABC-2 type transport system permease protein
MLPSAQANWNSSASRRRGARAARAELAAAWASWRAMTSERLYLMGLSGGLATLLVMPLFQVGTLAVIYGIHSDLFSYAIVAMAGNAFVMNTLFWVGEILDRERVKGTLVALFMTPCSRYAWLGGFTAAGLAETLVVATFTIVIGRVGFGVHFNPNVPALLVITPLFLASLWGMGLVFSGIGLLLKKSNQLANLVYNFMMLLGGAYYPVAQMPDWLRYPARVLPLGYGLQALADAALHHASWRTLAPNLLPLAGFAVAMPLLGALAFRWLEHLVRVRGELDVY